MSIRVLICDDDPIVRDALSGYLRAAEDLALAGTAGTAEEALAVLGAGTRPAPPTGAPSPSPAQGDDPPAGEVADVVLMDLAMPGMGGIAGAQRILREHPGVAVILLTTFGTDDQVREAIAGGASGFLLKSATAASLVAAVRAAAAGAGVVITPQVAASLAAEPGRSGSAAPGLREAVPADPPSAGDPSGPAETGAAGGAPDAPEAGSGPRVPPAPAADPVLPTPEDTGPAVAGPPVVGAGASEPSVQGADAPLLTERELEVLHLLCRADTNTQIAAQLVLSESTVKKHVTSLMAKLGCTSRLQIAVRAFELGLAEPPAPRG